MTLYKLFDGTDVVSNETLDISGVAYDSRRVKEGYVFVALCGSNTNG